MSMVVAITECVQGFLEGAKEKGILADTTMRHVKNHIETEMGEFAYETIKEEFIDHLKTEVTRIHMNLSIECPPNSPDASKRGPKKRKKRTSKSTYDGGSSNDDSDDFVVVDKRKGSGGDAGVKSRGLHDSDGASDGDFVDDDERRQRKKKKFKSRGAENVKPNKRKGAIDEKKERRKDKNLAPKQQAEARQVSPEVQRLKDLAKRCGLVIPPACYKGQPDDEEMESRIGVYLLGPGGLPNLKLSPSEISKVKADRQLKMDLDGIDTTNIVSGRRSSSGTASAPSFNVQRLAAASDSDSD